MNIYELEVLSKQHQEMLLKIADEDRLLKEAFPERRRINLPALIQKLLRRGTREAESAKSPCCAPETSAGDI